jgi:hypothetical protein
LRVARVPPDHGTAHVADSLGYILGVGAAKGTVHHGTFGVGIFGPRHDARAERDLRHLTVG